MLKNAISDFVEKYPQTFFIVIVAISIMLLFILTASIVYIFVPDNTDVNLQPENTIATPVLPVTTTPVPQETEEVTIPTVETTPSMTPISVATPTDQPTPTPTPEIVPTSTEPHGNEITSTEAITFTNFMSLTLSITPTIYHNALEPSLRVSESGDVNTAIYGVHDVPIFVCFRFPRPHEVIFRDSNLGFIRNRFYMDECEVVSLSSEWIAFIQVIGDEQPWEFQVVPLEQAPLCSAEAFTMRNGVFRVDCERLLVMGQAQIMFFGNAVSTASASNQTLSTPPGALYMQITSLTEDEVTVYPYP